MICNVANARLDALLIQVTLFVYAQATSEQTPRISRPRHYRKDHCQAKGCAADLRHLPWYNRRNHICTEHKSATSFVRLASPIGQRVRFCQRCGVAHALSNFDGEKKSCRKLLQRHNARRRKTPSSASAPVPVGWHFPSPLRTLVDDLPQFIGELSGNQSIAMMLSDLDNADANRPDSPLLSPPEEVEWDASSRGTDLRPFLSSGESNEGVCCSGEQCVCCCSTARDDGATAEGTSPNAPAAECDVQSGANGKDDPHAHAAVTVDMLHPAHSENSVTLPSPTTDVVYAALVQGHLLHAQMLLAAARLTLHSPPLLK